MIKLRKLHLKDVPYILEWMHDLSISDMFNKDMYHMTNKDVEKFCVDSSKDLDLNSCNSLHFAIIEDEDDEYRGTISLKNIDYENFSAEYAVSIRKKYHGTGTAEEATRLILEKGFSDYGLHRIYLSVLENNKRAIHFYEKVGFVYEGTARESINKNNKFIDLRLYSMLYSEWKNN